MRISGDGTVNWVVVAIAAAAVAGAVAVCYFTFAGTGGGGASPERTRGMPFKCDSCGKEFSLSPVKYHEQLKEIGDVPREKQGKANCPLCGGRSCASYLDPRQGPGPGDGGTRETRP